MPALVQYILICIIATLSATTVATATVNLKPDKTRYTVGDQVIIAITLSDVPTIYGGGLNLTFNPAVVDAKSVQVNPGWNFIIKRGVIDNTAGVINDIFFTHFNGLVGDIPVATIILDTIASGSAEIGITESTIVPFTDTNGESIVFTTNNLASNIFINDTQDEQTETEQTNIEETINEQASTEQTGANQPETQQAVTDNRVYTPANRSLDNEDQSDTVENNGQPYSDAVITNRQQDMEVGSYNNSTENLKNSSTSGTGTDLPYSENSDKETSYEPTTKKISLPADNNSVSSTGDKGTDDTPILLLTLVFMMLAFISYTVFVYRKK